MDHGLEFIIPILEILDIEVCNILYNPGNIGKLIFSYLDHDLNTSVLELILHGPRLRINCSSPGNIGN